MQQTSTTSAQTPRPKSDRWLKEAFQVAAGQMLAVVGTLLGMKALTSLMPPSAYGMFALALTGGVFAQQMLFAPVSLAALRLFAPAHESAELPEYLEAVRRLSTIASCALSVIALLVACTAIAFQRTELVEMVLATFIYALVTGVNCTLDSIQNGMRRRLVVAWHQALGPSLRFGLAVACILIVGPKPEACLWAFGLASSVLFISQLLFYRQTVRPFQTPTQREKSARWCADAWIYAYPLALTGLLAWGQQSGDKWALERCCGSSAVGIYTALFAIGYSPVTLAGNVLLQYLSPVLFQHSGNASDGPRLRKVLTKVHTILAVTLAATAIGVFTATLVHRRLFKLLLGADYATASWLLPLVVLAAGLFVCGQVAFVIVQVFMQMSSIIAPRIGSTVIAVVGFYFGSRLYGIVGTVVAQVLFSVVYFAWTYLTARRLIVSKWQNI